MIIYNRNVRAEILNAEILYRDIYPQFIFTIIYLQLDNNLFEQLTFNIILL